MLPGDHLPPWLELTPSAWEDPKKQYKKEGCCLKSYFSLKDNYKLQRSSSACWITVTFVLKEHFMPWVLQLSFALDLVVTLYIYIYIYIYIFWPIILTYKATILDARPLFFFRKGKKSRPSLIKEHQHHLPTLETEGNFPMALILGKLVVSIQ
jgi:hypothetical protein